MACMSATGEVEAAPIAELQVGPTGERFGIYVHCLFCLRRCPYCDFNVAIYREDRVDPFVPALGDELAGYAALPWAGRPPAVSLFFGGGTPSLLPPDAVGALIAAARRGLGLQPDAEVTLEANPEDLEAGRLRAFRAAGVTRLSLGVQSLDDGLLRRLGREHTAAAARGPAGRGGDRRPVRGSLRADRRRRPRPLRDLELRPPRLPVAAQPPLLAPRGLPRPRPRRPRRPR